MEFKWPIYTFLPQNSFFSSQSLEPLFPLKYWGCQIHQFRVKLRSTFYPFLFICLHVAKNVRFPWALKGFSFSYFFTAEFSHSHSSQNCNPKAHLKNFGGGWFLETDHLRKLSSHKSIVVLMVLRTDHLRDLSSNNMIRMHTSKNCTLCRKNLFTFPSDWYGPLFSCSYYLNGSNHILLFYSNLDNQTLSFLESIYPLQSTHDAQKLTFSQISKCNKDLLDISLLYHGTWKHWFWKEWAYL